MWSLYEGDKFLEPLRFSNGKTQKDIVEEVLREIQNGHKIIFIHGVCGTGKSSVALNVARKLGKASVVVPIKNLQEQYKKDYEGRMYLKKSDGSKLNISVITGRKNHVCKFLEDNKNAIPVVKKETNANLHDIFAGKKEEVANLIQKDISADNLNIPCKIEIKEKNWNKIKKYLNQNKNINPNDFHELSDVTRVSIAGVCPYWSPVLPEKYDLKSFDDSKKKKYTGLQNQKFTYFQGKPGCGFYKQFDSFVESDVMVFNSLKYKLESALNRKPLTEVEIIDECDEFLDSFANQRQINIDRLQNSLIRAISYDEKAEKIIYELSEIVKAIKRNDKIREAIDNENMILPLKETGVYDLLRIFLDSPEFLDEIDDESYLFELEETARLFDGLFKDTYLTVSKKESGRDEDNLVVSLVTTNLEKRFQEMVEKNKILVLMSGTLHSAHVLRDIFGLTEYKVIEAETQHPGKIEVQRTGLEMDCKYANLRKDPGSREKYLKALSKCVETAKKPCLIHVNGFVDLPSEDELKSYDIDNLISKEKLRDLQKKYSKGKDIDMFKKGEFDVLFSTRSGRGMDFPGEQCNSIIFTKYPNPNVRDAFWKILNKTKPQHYWEFYKDKAKRELLQKIYRGLRFKEDHVYLLTPDTRVLDSFEN